MNVMSSFKQGIAHVSQTKRMILFAWFVNVAFAMVLALPGLNQLDGYLRNTVMDEKLLKGMDPAWAETFRADMEKSELVHTVDYTVFGYAPFLGHLEMQMNGTFIQTLGTFLYDFFIGWKLNPDASSLLFFLSLLYVCVSSFLAGGFISVYSKGYRSSFTEFLMDGARYFGKFFRLALVALLVYFIFFAVILDSINNGIFQWTQNSASETLPFLYYMLRNLVVLFLISFLFMIFDYARIRMILDDRTSALAASAAGARFAVPHFRSTYGLYLLLTLLGIVFVAIYAILERIIPQDSYWPLMLLFFLQQLYMLARFWLKGSFYACQTTLYQTISKEEHLRSIAAAPSTT